MNGSRRSDPFFGAQWQRLQFTVDEPAVRALFVIVAQARRRHGTTVARVNTSLGVVFDKDLFHWTRPVLVRLFSVGFVVLQNRVFHGSLSFWRQL